MPFEITVAVLLSQCIGMGGCRCPSERNVSLMILAYFSFNNSDLSSAYAADAATNLSIWNMHH